MSDPFHIPQDVQPIQPAPLSSPPPTPSGTPPAPVPSGPAPLPDMFGSAPKPAGPMDQLGQWVKTGALGAGLAPIMTGVDILSHIPTSFMPGGTDDKFNAYGKRFQESGDTEAYAHWLAAKAKADGDIIEGPRVKESYIQERLDLDDQNSKEGILGDNPGIATFNAGGYGTLGSALQGMVMGFLTGQQAKVESTLAGTPIGGSMEGLIESAIGIVANQTHTTFLTDRLGVAPLPQAAIKAAQALGENRIQDIQARAAGGQALDPREAEALAGINEHGWSAQHAHEFLTRNFAGYSDSFVTELAGVIALDPLTYEVPVAGGISKLGLTTGKKLLDVGAKGETLAERAAVLIAKAQEGPGGPAFRAAHVLIDPTQALPSRTPTEGLVDWSNANTVEATERAYGPGTRQDLYRHAADHGYVEELQRAEGAYTANMTRLFVTMQERDAQMLANKGEALMHVSPEDTVKIGMVSQARDSVDELTDLTYKVSKSVFTKTDIDMLAKRMTAWLGRSTAEWAKDIANAHRDLRSYWHALSFNGSERGFFKALGDVVTEGPGKYEGRLPLHKMAVLNDSNLDNVSAQGLLDALDAATSPVEKQAVWNLAADRHPEIRSIGLSGGSEAELRSFRDELQALLDEGHFHVRVEAHELADPALRPLRDWLNAQTIDGEQIWHLGFRPDEDVAWAMRRHPVSGNWYAVGNPTISHVQDAPLAALPFSHTTRNFLGQIIGTETAGKLARPVESIEAFLKTALDQVSGRRVMANYEKRFEAIAVEKLGLGTEDARVITKIANDIVDADRTIVKGINGDNLWAKAQSAIPQHLRGKITQRDLVGAILEASEGDLRIIGTGSKFTQKQRTILARAGADSNAVGQVTVTQYNKMRYLFNPTFIAQRITDAPFYLALRGIMPVGKQMYGDTERVANFMRTMGRTGLSRDTAMDLPDLVVRSDFTNNVWGKVEERMGSRLSRLRQSPDIYIRNNMARQIQAGLGAVLREVIDEQRVAIERLAKTEPEMAAEMSAELDKMEQGSMARMRQAMSERAGHILDDEEMAIQYVEEQLASQARRTVRADGTDDLRRLINEADMMGPGDVGELRPIPLDDLAEELHILDDSGKASEASLREFVQKQGITYVKDLALKQLKMHADGWARVEAALRTEWRPFWDKVKADLQLTDDVVAEMENVVAREAQHHGMDPHIYLSQIMHFNVGPSGMSEQMRLLADLLKAGKEGGLEQAVRAFRGNMDLSQHRTLVDYWRETLPEAAAEARAQGDVARATELESIAATLERGVNPPPAPAARVSESVMHSTLNALPQHQRDAIARVLDAFYDTFPDLPRTEVYIDPTFTARNPGEVFAEHMEDGRIALSPRYYNAEGATEELAKAEGVNDLFWETQGVPTLVSMTPEGTIRHELGHKIDEWMRSVHYRIDPSLTATEQAEVYAARKAYRNFIEEFYNSGRAQNLSVYAGRAKKPGEQTGQEAAAELYDLAFGTPEEREAFFDRMLRENTTKEAALREGLTVAQAQKAMLSYIADVEDDILRYRELVEDLEIYRPRPAPAETVNYNAAFDAAFADNIARRAAGEAIENPEIEAATQNFVRWAEQALGENMGEELRAITNAIPTDEALRYNRTEALTQRLFRHKIGLLENDAFRLAENKTKRNVFERSLNHPVWGMYPASYMYGKVLPESLRFFARNPYGATYKILQVEQALAMQREWDPEFATANKALDESETAFVAGYLTPSFPWEAQEARAPKWFTDMLKVGFDPSHWVESQMEMMDPSRWWSFLTGPIEEAGDFARSELSGPTPASTLPDMFGAGGISQTPAPTATPQADLSQPVQATELAPALADDMQALAELLR